MSQEYEPVQIRELLWLARYYEMHGHLDEAHEIREAIANHSSGTDPNKPAIAPDDSEKKSKKSA